MNERSVHRILLVSIYVATSNFEDVLYEKTYFAQVAGIQQKELVLLEKEYFKLLNFDFFLSQSSFSFYY